MIFPRIAAASCLPLLLAGCLLAPGRFTSSLDIRADRSFTFAYQGEVHAVASDGDMEQALAALIAGKTAGTGAPAARQGRVKVTGTCAWKSNRAAAFRVAQTFRTTRSGLASAAATGWRPQKRGRLWGEEAARALRRMGRVLGRPSLTGKLRPAICTASPWTSVRFGADGQVAEWLKAADCKSARASVRWFESSPVHQPRPAFRRCCASPEPCRPRRR